MLELSIFFCISKKKKKYHLKLAFSNLFLFYLFVCFLFIIKK